VVYEYTNPDEDGDGEISVMTTENCDTENWEADEKIDNPTDKYGKIFVSVSALVTWFMELIKKIFKIG
jgi:hypothetical protein